MIAPGILFHVPVEGSSLEMSRKVRRKKMTMRMMMMIMMMIMMMRMRMRMMMMMILMMMMSLKASELADYYLGGTSNIRLKIKID